MTFKMLFWKGTNTIVYQPIRPSLEPVCIEQNSNSWLYQLENVILTGPKGCSVICAYTSSVSASACVKDHKNFSSHILTILTCNHIFLKSIITSNIYQGQKRALPRLLKKKQESNGTCHISFFCKG